ncbi:MAG TPA: TonB-dependent receptor [Rhodanobacteraceae bacterium]
MKLRGIAAAVSLTLGTLGFAGIASAQTTPPPPAAGSTAPAPAASSGEAPAAKQATTEQPSHKQKSTTAAQSGVVSLGTIVVTGSTGRHTTLLNTSDALTYIDSEQLQQFAPAITDDVMNMVPGIFVEGTAGPVSDNYSVRGLPGGGQEFVRILEDGMPLIYGGLNDDEVFQYSPVAISHVEAVEGGSSGILAPNAAGASINFITRPLNFNKAGGIAQITGTSYGEGRVGAWYSAPIAKGLSFAATGYYDTNPGTRDSAFRYNTWHGTLQLQKDFDNGATVKLTYKQWNEHDPFYADQPYADHNGKIGSVPGLGTQFGNIIGPDFANITMPDSCAAGECLATFSEQNGIHATGRVYRLDAKIPFNDDLSAFAHVLYTRTNWDFNGVFAGSASGNSGLESAVDYLNPEISPIANILALGQSAYPGASQFGIMNVATGVVIPGSDTAALNALNGNGLLEQTVLNRQVIGLKNWGSNFGVKWFTSGLNWDNDITIGGMIYSTKETNDQSAVSSVLNDVANQSNIYNVAALNPAGDILGVLTNNGLISYGDWGAGISSYNQSSDSGYFNDILTLNRRLRISVGARYEHEEETALTGNSSSAPVAAGVPGVLRTTPNAFNGTFSTASGAEDVVNWTVGANYIFNPNLSVFGRFARSYETQGLNPKATALLLSEIGGTFSGDGFVGNVTFFRTEFNNQSFGGGVDPANPDLNLGFFGNSDTDGVDISADYRPMFAPLRAFAIRAQATFQKPAFNNVATGVTNAVDQHLAAEVDTFYDGKVPGRTPKVMYMITPQYNLPDDRGQVYLRWQYIGRIFADDGDQVVLPGYGTLSVGAIYNLSRRVRLLAEVDNVNNALGLTEGNPRQGFTQEIINGFFYGRGIVGRTARVSLRVKF